MILFWCRAEECCSFIGYGQICDIKILEYK